MDANEGIKNIVIVGGGSAGWMSATYLASQLHFQVNITVIEAPDIERIGVGEATVTTIKTEFFDRLGLSESQWMPPCQASYKMGIRYANWRVPPQKGGDYFYHIFGEIPYIDEVPLTHVWIKKKLENPALKPMAYTCYPCVTTLDLNKSPKLLDDTRAQYYAYHLDAALLAKFLCKWAVKRHIRHVQDRLTHAEFDEQGNIRCVVGESGEKYSGDLFLDCSGFFAFLIEKTLKEPFVEFHDSVLTDRAIAINLPENSAITGIRPYTTATALKAGWMWEIPHYYTSGNGYVYSSQFCSENEAEQEVREFFGKRADNATLRHIKFRSGRRRSAWVKNCVSIGLSSNFLEPLESTGLYFIYAALYQLVRNFPYKHIDPVFRENFNKKIRYMIDENKDFIIMHFKTAARDDTPFWKANRHETHMPDSLKLLLEQHKAGFPIKTSHTTDLMLYASFGVQFENLWTNSNYQSILCGVGYLPDQSLPLLHYRSDIISRAEKIFSDFEQQSHVLAKTLPSQFDYLTKLYQMAEVEVMS